MFEKLTLTNFQCHESRELDLDRITTFVGKSDSGKSAVVRSLEWVCFNNGSPSALLRRGADDMSVRLQADGHVIERFRTKSKNGYYFDGNVSNAIGKGVPHEIEMFLRMGEDNVQQQFDAYYWFNATGSELVSKLNRIVDLTKLEQWIKTGASKERQLKERQAYLAEREKTVRSYLEALAPYRALEKDLDVLERQQAKYAEAKIKKDEYNRLLICLEDFQTDIGMKAVRRDCLHTFVELFAELQTRRELLDNLTAVLTGIDQKKKRASLLRKMVSVAPDADSIISEKRRYSALSQIVVSLRDPATWRDRLLEKQNCLHKLLDNFRTLQNNAKKYKLLLKYTSVVLRLCLLRKRGEPLGELFSDLLERKTYVDNAKNVIVGIEKYRTALLLARRTHGELCAEFEEKSGGLCPICGSKI